MRLLTIAKNRGKKFRERNNIITFVKEKIIPKIIHTKTI